MTEIEKAVEELRGDIHWDRPLADRHLAALLAAITRREAEVRAEAVAQVRGLALTYITGTMYRDQFKVEVDALIKEQP